MREAFRSSPCTAVCVKQQDYHKVLISVCKHLQIRTRKAFFFVLTQPSNVCRKLIFFNETSSNQDTNHFPICFSHATMTHLHKNSKTKGKRSSFFCFHASVSKLKGGRGGRERWRINHSQFISALVFLLWRVSFKGIQLWVIYLFVPLFTFRFFTQRCVRRDNPCLFVSPFASLSYI